ncbi:MAG: nuclear transport factor 2 family protein [Rhodocyclaceae bacterium]|nr:nuclear transport factor 2 family protein [Rhodocyclaceae bacterium]
MPSVKAFFASPQEAESAFYDALERADLDAMMGVWAGDDEVVCIHPGGPRLTGFPAVRDAWAQVFKGVKRLSVRRVALVQTQALMMAVHSVVQYISSPDDKRAMPPVVATNVYRRAADGWRLLMHHSSPMPTPSQEPQANEPRILH